MSTTEQLILIVDDSPTNIRVLADLIGREYDVKVAKSGRSALEIISTPPFPDLILLDIMMPEMNGYDTCQKIKENELTQNIPVIFITAKTEDDDIIKGFRVGGIDYITKPFNKDELMARVRTHAELKSFNDELEARVAEETHKRLSQDFTFKQMFDSLPSQISLVNRNHNFMAVNKAFKSYVGKSEKEIIGGHAGQIMTPEQYEKLTLETENVLDGKTRICREKVASLKGTTDYFETVYSPLYDSEHQITGIIINSKDITVNKQLEKEIRRREEMLIQQKRFADMGQMINAIAHQWRQPLNNLFLTSQMLQDMDSGENYGFDRDELYSMQENLVEYMSKTIDDFRNYFSTHNGKLYFSLIDETEESLKLVNAQLSALSIDTEIRYNIPDDTDPEVKEGVFHGYPGGFRQVLLSILSNAKDAVLEWQPDNPDIRGKILVMFSVDEEHYHIVIENTGNPIPGNVIEKIFNPYFTTKDEGKGTGIGLYMAKVIMDNDLKGEIYAENTARGVAFHVLLKIPSKEDRP